MNKKHGNCTHGLRKHKLYNVWNNIKLRCYNTNNKDYKNYGKRGIILCDEWRNDFLSFYEWAISVGWQKGLEIDRINNNGNYCPENCRFVNKRTNTSNRRSNSKYGTGVNRTKYNKFQVKITDSQGKIQCCGNYNTIERAQEVYNLSLMALKLGKS